MWHGHNVSYLLHCLRRKNQMVLYVIYRLYKFGYLL